MKLQLKLRIHTQLKRLDNWWNGQRWYTRLLVRLLRHRMALGYRHDWELRDALMDWQEADRANPESDWGDE